MARTARIDIENYWYHIIARGLNSNKLFLKEEDYSKYINLLNKTLERFNGYLMPNHIHLLIYRQDQELNKIFHIVQGAYSRYFNSRNRRAGYLFQGRYKSKLILSEKYLDTLVNYIHQNPVRARISNKVDEYFWSSDRYYRSDIRNGLIRFKRVPGYEGKAGERKYAEIVTESVEYPESGNQYIGNKEAESDLRRKKIKRYRKERRSLINLEDRIFELKGKDKDLISKLQSAKRERGISGVRQKLMVKLYEEGYSPGIIAGYFKRTPSAVIRAVERKSQ